MPWHSRKNSGKMVEMSSSSSDDQHKQIMEGLKRTLDEAEWSWLIPHFERGSLLLVLPGIDLLDVGYRVAVDDKAAVAAWVKAGKIKRPTDEQIEAWNKEPSKKFMSVVVQPYVLIQEQFLH